MKLGRESLPWHLNVRAIYDSWDYRRARTPDLCTACGMLAVPICARPYKIAVSREHQTLFPKWDRCARPPHVDGACGAAPAVCVCGECLRCDAPVPAGSGETFDGAVFCSSRCLEAHGEAAWERACSDYYGGSGPATLNEQLAEARRLK